MALLSHGAAVCAAAALLGTACGAGETGHVELERAVVARDAAADDATERLEGFMFSTRQSSRFEPDGLLLYFELALDDGTGAELEIDLPREPGLEAVVHYTEATESRLTFESDSAVGAVEFAEDLDGRLCSCADGRFDLRLTDDGADGEVGTDDDQVRELRNGVYHWAEQPCERDGNAAAVALADLDRVEVRPVDHCMGRPQEPAVPTPVVGPTRGPRVSDVDWHEHRYDPFYDHHSHHVVHVEAYGCGGDPSGSQATTSAGCGGSSSESDTEASGCEADTQSSSSAGCSDDSGFDDQDSSSASGCEGSDSDSARGSSGCDGDDHESSSGCEQDTRSSARSRPHLLAGPFQNYLWLAFGAVFPSWRARRRLRK